jgi:uncharacterized protein
MLEAQAGDVHLNLVFGIGESGNTTVNGSASAEVQLVCQKCLKQFGYPLGCRVALQIVTDESRLARQEDEIGIVDLDTIVHDDKLIAIVDLVEDDLILAVPMVPRHENECPATEYQLAPQAPLVREEEPTTYRPFADLAKTIEKQNEMES